MVDVSITVDVLPAWCPDAGGAITLADGPLPGRRMTRHGGV